MDSTKDLTQVEQEIRSLFQACTGKACPADALQLYLDSEIGRDSSAALPAPRWILESPFWLSVFEPLPGRSPAYDVRRKAVLQLAESLPATTQLFHAGAAPGRLRTWLGLIVAGAIEGLKLPVRFAAGVLFW